ncbi:hypothetical protein GCM10027594_18050 [Hymenobacter agri]
MEKGILQAELSTWLGEVITTEKLPAEICAFRFGLGEVAEGYVLYLAGSNHHDETDDEWAAYPPEFVAATELVIPAAGDEEWYWVLLDVIYSLGKVLRSAPISSSFLGGHTPVYTGFESGDLYRLK